MIRVSRVLLACIIIFTSLAITASHELQGQEAIPKALIQLDMARVDVTYNITGVNFATFTGAVVFNLNETEDGYVELEADAGGWPLVISPRAFYVPPNTTSMNFVVDIDIPPDVDGGTTRIMEIGGTIVTSEDNTTALTIEPSQGIISVLPAYSVGIEFSTLYQEIPPARQTTFTVKVINYGSEGIFRVNIQNIGELQEKQWAVTLQPSVLHLGSGNHAWVNISVNLPALWTLWTSHAYPIVLNVTTDNGTFLENSAAYLNVEGFFLGGFEWILCLSLILIFFVLPLLLAVGYSRSPKGKELLRLKAEKKIAKMEAKLRRKGIIVSEEDISEKHTEEQEKEPEPLKCPMCYSENVKALLSGKYKCRDCQRLFEMEDTGPDMAEGTIQGP